MYKILLLLSFILLNSIANDLNSCKGCHPIIYQEFEHSMHKKSTIKEDRVHKTIWEKYPDKKEYRCAKCHAPQSKSANSNSGVTCITCHTIKDIKEHPKANENIYEKKDRLLYSAQEGMEDKIVIYKKESSFFGLFTKVVGSPYHDIDYRNEIFYTGRVCMGCHSHKKNKRGLDVCRTDNKGAKNRHQNCITCHMPKVKGSATNIRITKTHAYHGFAGVFNSPKLLSKYINIDYKKLDNGFNIIIENKSPHNLLLHPLRVLELRTKLKRDKNTTELKRYRFQRVLGKGKRATMPWLATKVLKDTTIRGEENRSVEFNISLKEGDEIEALLGYYIVNPKIAKELKLEDDKNLTKFIILKDAYFEVKK